MFLFPDIYIIVSVDEHRADTDTVRYSIAVASKEGVPGWKPKLPDPPVFIHGSAARDFLLEKRTCSFLEVHFLPSTDTHYFMCAC